MDFVIEELKKGKEKVKEVFPKAYELIKNFELKKLDSNSLVLFNSFVQMATFTCYEDSELETIREIMSYVQGYIAGVRDAKTFNI